MTGHHELKANDLVIGDQGWGLKCQAELERARGHVTDLVAALELKSQLAKPKRTRGPSSFMQADVTRAVKGAKAGGSEVRKVEVTKEKITVEVGKAGEQSENVLPFDQWKARHVR